MNKRVLVISGSPRAQGNSDLLCDEVVRGAKAAGHEVHKYCLRDAFIHPCIGCGHCMQTMDGTCVQNDDMAQLLDLMVQADVILFATPVYFYNMNAQMKLCIDRTCPRYNELHHKTFGIIMSAAETDRTMMDTVLQSFQGFFNCLDDVTYYGTLYGLGVHTHGEVAQTSLMQEAYAFGNNIT